MGFYDVTFPQSNTQIFPKILTQVDIRRFQDENRLAREADVTRLNAALEVVQNNDDKIISVSFLHFIIVLHHSDVDASPSPKLLEVHKSEMKESILSIQRVGIFCR